MSRLLMLYRETFARTTTTKASRMSFGLVWGLYIYTFPVDLGIEELADCFEGSTSRRELSLESRYRLEIFSLWSCSSA